MRKTNVASLVFALIISPAQSFGMSKGEVLNIVKSQLEQKHERVSADLNAKIEQDQSLTDQEWDLFVQRIRTIESQVIVGILAEYYFQVASHYMNVKLGTYHFAEAMKYYELAAEHGHATARRQFAFLGIGSRDSLTHARAFAYLVQCARRDSENISDWDTRALNCLGVQYEDMGFKDLAFDCYEKAVKRLQYDKVQDLEELIVWQNYVRLQESM